MLGSCFCRNDGLGLRRWEARTALKAVRAVIRGILLYATDVQGQTYELNHSTV